MVKSTSSCFKIITCSSDSVEDDDLERIEKKGSTDKRRWSFRKNSGRHQVLNNTMTPEASSTENKENPESTSVLFNAQSYPAVPEKLSVSQFTDDLKPVSDAINLKQSDSLIATEIATGTDPLISTETLSKGDSLIIVDSAVKIDTNLEEAVVIIQAAIRGYLSQRALLKHKNVIKLQAAFRGLLVRRQAVGTLRCVQAIIKMQALVRSRRARMASEGSTIEEKFDEKHDQSVKLPVKEISGTKIKSKFSSTEKLLGNGFARQLLESMPKKKPIRVKCDPLRPDSAWKWLERWVSVSSSDFTQPQKPQLNSKNEEQLEMTDGSTRGLETEDDVLSESVDLKSNVSETETPVKAEENLTAYDANNFQFQFCPPTSSIVGNDANQHSSADFVLNEAQENSLNTDTNQIELRLDGASNKVLGSASNKPEDDSEPSKHSMKQVSSEQTETEGRKIVVGSRKSRNPAFAAAQSKFEELSSPSTAGKSIASNHHDIEVESKLANLPPSADSESPKKVEELMPIDNLVSEYQRIHMVGLECGTEFPVSSRLAPERSEIVYGQHGSDSKVASNSRDLDDESKEEAPSVSAHPKKIVYANGEANDSSQLNGEVVDSVYANGEAAGSVYGNGEAVAPGYANREAVDSVYADAEIVDLALSTNLEQQLESSASDMQTKLNNTEDRQAYRSPDGTPRSHITAPESHGTPSSQVSVDAKKKKLNKKQRRKSESESKRSPSNPNHDSGGRNSSEQVQKDIKNGKRRNSFGLAKLDLGDQESRDSSSNSLPSYMQATQSAKAKVNANNSPRSSPDVQDNEHYIKKRHSLPNANGKQGSPRIQSSTPPQAQLGGKGHRERWQR